MHASVLSRTSLPHRMRASPLSSLRRFSTPASVSALRARQAAGAVQPRRSRARRTGICRLARRGRAPGGPPAHGSSPRSDARTEALAQQRHVVEAVEQRHDERRRARVDPRERLLQRRRLRRDDQHVDRLGQLRDGGGPGREVAEGDALDARSRRARSARRSTRARRPSRRRARARSAAASRPPTPPGPRIAIVTRHARSISTPGFSMPAGSTAAFAPRSAAANGSGRWRSYQGR